MVEVLEKAASNLGRRTARALVSRFGEKDGYDFYSEVKLCGECNGLSKDYFTDVNCVPCRGKGVRVRHFTLQRTQLGRSVVRGKPVELTGEVWQVERSAQEVLLRLPEECR